MKIALTYFGTSTFSATVLEALATNELFEVAAVVTQPGRPVGREQVVTDSPVKVAALKYGIPVFEPESLKNFGVQQLPKTDVAIVFAYGLIIPQAILDTPKHGTLNIHPSLLPLYRGPTPVQSALIKGETETGVSIMLLDAEMDHGPILDQITTSVAPHDTTATLTAKLVEQAIPLLIKLIPEWTQEKIVAREQDHTTTTYCKMLDRNDGKIDWSKPAKDIYNLYRGLTPWPGVWTTWGGKRLKLLNIKLSDTKTEPGAVEVASGSIHIGTTKGSIEVTELQLEGKKAMTAQEFLNGYKNFNSETLGS